MKVDGQNNGPQERAKTRGGRYERLGLANSLERFAVSPVSLLLGRPVVLEKVDGSDEVPEGGEKVGDREEGDQFLSSCADLREHEEGEDDEDGAQTGEGAGGEGGIAGSRADAEADAVARTVELLRTLAVVVAHAVFASNNAHYC